MMLNKSFILLALLLCAMTANAENYPYRSDYLWVTVPDHPDWVYQTGEEAHVEIQFYKYGIPREGELEYSIGTDLLPYDKSGRCRLKNGRATINMGTCRTPGFRDLRLTLKLDGTTYRHHVKVGFSPEQIRPFTKEPEDFRSFWEKQVADNAKTPLHYTKEYVPEMSDEVEDVWLVKLHTDSRHHLYGYLLVPKGCTPGSCPVVFTPPGAGVKTIKEVTSRRYYQENGMIRFVTEIHGLRPTLDESDFEDLRSAFSNYLEMGLDSRERYYMHHVYLGLVKCIDFLTSLPEWDGKNVAVMGGSQGGALSLIAASLDPRVTLCVANHPALSDMAAGSAGLTSGYPHFKAEQGIYTDANVRTMAYYDVVNFARYVTCPTFLTWGFNDDTCPPTTSYAVWNTLNCEKEKLVTPINEHWTSDATNRLQMEWIKARLK
ncbi:MAG: acetylxylan esterase [Prevotella sp.]|nr:acetylxylan esterase [Prevotella sp.]